MVVVEGVSGPHVPPVETKADALKLYRELAPQETIISTPLKESHTPLSMEPKDPLDLPPQKVESA